MARRVCIDSPWAQLEGWVWHLSPPPSQPLAWNKFTSWTGILKGGGRCWALSLVLKHHPFSHGFLFSSWRTLHAFLLNPRWWQRRSTLKTPILMKKNFNTPNVLWSADRVSGTALSPPPHYLKQAFRLTLRGSHCFSLFSTCTLKQHMKCGAGSRCRT